MPGKLRCDHIDLNEKETVESLQAFFEQIVRMPDLWHELAVKGNYYFETPERLDEGPGWYIISNEKNAPLYVGESKSINQRLNTKNGTRDQFANPQRKSDMERNFIKKFLQLAIISRLRVCVLSERALCSQFSLKSPLSELDRKNIEKFINIFR
jgi:hypothetical protein